MWYGDPQAYTNYQRDQKNAMTTFKETPWMDPNSEWYKNSAGYQNYNQTRGAADAGATSLQIEQQNQAKTGLYGSGDLQAEQSRQALLDAQQIDPAKRQAALGQLAGAGQVGGLTNDVQIAQLEKQLKNLRGY
jgi:hypothetical protein